MSGPNIGKEMLQELGAERAEEMAALVDKAAMIDFFWIDGKLHARSPTDPPGFALVEISLKIRLEHEGVGYTYETSQRFK